MQEQTYVPSPELARQQTWWAYCWAPLLWIGVGAIGLVLLGWLQAEESQRGIWVLTAPAGALLGALAGSVGIAERRRARMESIGCSEQGLRVQGPGGERIIRWGEVTGWWPWANGFAVFTHRREKLHFYLLGLDHAARKAILEAVAQHAEKIKEPKEKQ
jgi:hypothetical protein